MTTMSMLLYTVPIPIRFKLPKKVTFSFFRKYFAFYAGTGTLVLLRTNSRNYFFLYDLDYLVLVTQ